uniref:Uncharacterized protein n=1 Tax=Oryza glumipatula TaxID=40148 RepID=A0A0E0B4G7_9ORYZ
MAPPSTGARWVGGRPMLGWRRPAMADAGEGETTAPPTADARREREGGQPAAAADAGVAMAADAGVAAAPAPISSAPSSAASSRPPRPPGRLPPSLRPPPHLPPSDRLPVPALPRPKQAQAPPLDDGHRPAVSHHCHRAFVVLVLVLEY